jgi:hypothetical protein
VSEQNKDKAAERRDSITERKQELDAAAGAEERRLRAEEIEAQRQSAATNAAAATQGHELRLQGVREVIDSREEIAGQQANVKLETNEEDNATAIEIAETNAKTRRGTNLKTGTGINPGN